MDTGLSTRPQVPIEVDMEMAETPEFVDDWLSAHPGTLSDADAQDLRQFGRETTMALGGDLLDEIRLSGEPDRPVLAVIFHPPWAKRVRWSFEWRLEDVPISVEAIES